MNLAKNKVKIPRHPKRRHIMNVEKTKIKILMIMRKIGGEGNPSERL
jgi:hypothetical protein